MDSLRQHRWTAAVVIALGCQAGCSPQGERYVPPQTTKIPDGKSAEIAVPPQSAFEELQRAEPPEDRSWDVDGYVAAGLPAPDRNWTGVDFTTCAHALEEISRTNPAELPRHGSPRSGEMFARMISRENLKVLHHRSLPMKERLQMAVEYGRGVNQILMIYNAAQPDDQLVYGREVIELFGSNLRLQAIAVQLAEQIVAELDTEDPTYTDRMQKIQQLHGDTATIVVLALHLMKFDQAFEVAELKRLTAYVTESVPGILQKLPAKSREEILTRLRSFDADPRMQDLRPELTELIEAIDAAHESAGENSGAH